MFESDQIGGRAGQFDMHEPAFFHDVELGTTVHVTGLRAMGQAPVGLSDGGEQHGGDAGAGGGGYDSAIGNAGRELH